MNKTISDPLLERAIVFVKGLESVSILSLQSQFHITYMTAGMLLDEMVQRRLISAKKDAGGKHQVKTKIKSAE